MLMTRLSVLDLHGYTAKEAEDKTASYIKAAAKNGLQSLLIITGKGLHSEGEGILRDVVEALLIAFVKTLQALCGVEQIADCIGLMDILLQPTDMILMIPQVWAPAGLQIYMKT